jgi:RNA recognition motif-containing protein
MEIFVGNLAPETTEDHLKPLFKTFGDVKSVEVKRDLFSGQSKGFAFVEMPGKQHSLNAIRGLNGQELNGKPLTVNESRPRPTGGRGGRRR